MTEQEWNNDDAALDREYGRLEALEREDIVLGAIIGWARASERSRAVDSEIRRMKDAA